MATSRMATAFSNLQKAQARATGKPQKVWIGRKSYDAIVETLTEAEVMVAGGVAESGGFKASIAVSLYGATQPKRFTPAHTEGSWKLEVLSCNTVNGVTHEIVIGDSAIDSP